MTEREAQDDKGGPRMARGPRMTRGPQDDGLPGGRLVAWGHTPHIFMGALHAVVQRKGPEQGRVRKGAADAK